MITSDNYRLLSNDAKANILWREGTYLEEVIDYGKSRILIYELNSFFVGVFYSLKENKIEKVEILSTGTYKLKKTISLN